nr:MAG TPA: hypothetical protein [Caudoviricetes sp.]
MGIKYWGRLIQALRRPVSLVFVESMTAYSTPLPWRSFCRWCITGSGTLCRPISD